MMAKMAELDKGGWTEFRLKKGVRVPEALEQPSGHNGKWSFMLEIVKFVRGITCYSASKRRLLQVLHSRDLVPPWSSTTQMCPAENVGVFDGARERRWSSCSLQ